MSFVPRFYRLWSISGLDEEPIASASLRSPQNKFEVVDTYPVPYVLLDEVYTAPRYRRQGLALGLINLALEEASRQGWAVLCRPVAHGRGKMTRAGVFEFYRAQFNFRPDPHQQLTDDWLVKCPPLRLIEKWEDLKRK